ncbi:ABC transporter substrate-binding protein [Martelella soudanensis]|uniref:ABC transporter substrate-binding protein n=1 Tax=unclassified Martelella TaxID=2629616 RepID=UPI0015DE739F|nr:MULTISPECIES: ABC transporter substrate-binding protein [unclassified Martelella]
MIFVRLLGWVFVMLLPGGLVAADEPTRAVIADDRAEWGQPAPYLHQMSGPGYVWMTFLFDTLIGQDDTGAPVSALATDWSVSPDGLIYQVNLNSQALWHDGETVTTADVVFTFDYVQRHPHPFVSLADVSSVSASADTVRITLSRPDPGFLSDVLMSLPILPEHIYSGIANPRDFVDATALTGSGPFMLTSSDRAQGRYTLTAAPKYYGKAPKFDEIVFVRMAGEAALNAMAEGWVDVFTYLPWHLTERARSLGIALETAPSNHPVRIVFNHAGLFGDLAARQALAYSLDRNALARVAYVGGAEKAQVGYFQQGTAWFDAGAQLDYDIDPQRAVALFAAAGLTRTKDGLRSSSGDDLRLRLITDGRQERVAIVLSEHLETIGFDVDLRVLERGALQAAAAGDDFDLALLTTSTIGDPGDLASKIFGDDWRSDGYPQDDRLQEVIRAQATETDPIARAALLAEFQRLYSEQLPSLMLVNPTWVTPHSDRIAPRFFPDGIAMGIPVSLHKPAFTR